MKKNAIVLLVLMLGLVGCKTESTNQPRTSVENSWTTFSEFPGFAFQYPASAAHRIKRSDGSIALATSKGPSMQDTAGDYYIAIYQNSPSPHCGNIGVSEPTVVGDPAGEIKIMRGKVDFFERYGSDYEPGTEPQCRPYGGGAAYVLCSEKNGKTVLICISEVTDDPALAEGVFDTFRWVK